MTDYSGYLNISYSNAFYFLNASNNDMLIYPETSNQKVHIGITSNANSCIVVNSNNTLFNTDTILSSNLNVSNVANFQSSVNVVGQLTVSNAVNIIDTTNNIFNMTEYNNVDGAVIRAYRAKGTIAAPTALVSGDTITGLRAFGYNGSTFVGQIGAVNIVASSNYSVGNTGTYINFSTSASNATSSLERMRITDIGNVGIGTTSPLTTLHMASLNTFAQIIDASNSSTGTTIGIYQNYAGSINSNMMLGISGGNNQFSSDAIKGDAIIRTNYNRLIFNTNNGGASTMCMLSNRYIGLSTSSPNLPLSMTTPINTSTTSYNLVSYVTGTGGGIGNFTGTQFTAGDNGTQSLLLYAGGSYPNGAGIIQSKDVLSSRNYGQKLLLNPDGGNVGINTNSPGYTLDVNGIAYIRSSLYVGSSNVAQNSIFFGGQLGDFGSLGQPYSAIISRNYDPAGSTAVTSDYSEILIIQMNDPGPTSGPDRIRHVAAAHKFQVYNAAITPADTNTFYADNNYTTAMYINPTGQVGIGTTNQNAPLQLANTLANRKLVLYDTNNNDHQYYGFGIQSGTLRYQVDATTSAHIFYAATSASASSELMRLTGTGNLGIGMTPSYTLDVTGQVRYTYTTGQGLILKNTQTGANTANEIYFDSSASTGTTAQLAAVGMGGNARNFYIWVNGSDRLNIDTSGNVGIGKISPVYKLDVAGDINTSTTMRSVTLSNSGHLQLGGNIYMNNANIIYGTNSTGTQEVFLYPRFSDNVTYLNFGSAGFNIRNNSSTSVMFMQNGGNVGIGTNSPAYTLDVNGDIHSTGNIYTDAGHIVSSVNSLVLNTTNTGSIYLRSDIVNGIVGAFSNIATFSTNSHTFYTNNTVALQINSSGYVGIGTSTPAAKLDVAGNIRIYESTGSTNSAYTGSLTLYHDDSGGKSSIVFPSKLNYGSDYGYITFYDNVAGTGYNYWGGSSEVAALVLGVENDGVGAAGPDSIILNPAGNIAFVPRSGTNYFTGNVGIGTASPGYTLHVVGNIYATGNITAFSDSNYKKDLVYIDNALDKIDKLNGYTFSFKSDTDTLSSDTNALKNASSSDTNASSSNLDTTTRYAGLLAQEVREVLPEAVMEDKEGKLSVAYGNMMALAINAIKELKAEINSIKQNLKM